MQTRNKMLGTFTTKELVNDTIESIRNKHTLSAKHIFVLELRDSEELLCTYNVIDSIPFLLPSSLVLHRQKDLNVLYSINALNLLIKELNGKVDNTYKVDWTKYRSSIILTNNDRVRITQTRIYKIV